MPRAKSLTQPGLSFVAETGHGKTNDRTRKLIRRQVMLGKNRKPAAVMTRNGHDHQYAEYEDALARLIVTIPGRVGGDLSFIRFADAIEPEVFTEVLQFSFDAKKALWPLEPCIKFSKRKGEWLEPLADDAAYLHVMVSSIHWKMSLVGRGSDQLTQQVAVHHHKALMLLRERLASADEAAKTSDMTIAVVLGLALQALVVGDFTTTKFHMDGFRQMVQIRGGGPVFMGHTKLIAEMIRADLTVAIHTRQRPVLFASSHELNDRLTYPWDTLCKDETPLSIITPPSSPPSFCDNDDLLEAWQILRLFCGKVNECTSMSRQIPDIVVIRVMGSVMYRTLGAQSERSEAISVAHLGMLAFCNSIFLQWPGAGIVSTGFGDSFETELRSHFFPSKVMADDRLAIWCVTLGLISRLLQEDGEWIDWLRAALNRLGIRSWPGLCSSLKDFLWIDVIHDRPAIALCEGLMLNKDKADGHN